MIKKTIWKPDTCGCAFEYEWDSDSKESDRIHSWSDTLAQCADHAGLSPKECFANASAENRTKNITRTIILSTVKRLTDGNGQFKAGVDWAPVFSGKDGDRSLAVSIQGDSLSAEEKSALQASVAGLEKMVSFP